MRHGRVCSLPWQVKIAAPVVAEKEKEQPKKGGGGGGGGHGHGGGGHGGGHGAAKKTDEKKPKEASVR